MCIEKYLTFLASWRLIHFFPWQVAEKLFVTPAKPGSRILE
jgi:hypothetical protein